MLQIAGFFFNESAAWRFENVAEFILTLVNSLQIITYQIFSDSVINNKN